MDIQKLVDGFVRVLEASLPFLQVGTLGLAFVATLAGFFLLLFSAQVRASSAVALMLSAAVLMVVSTVCRLPEVNAMQKEVTTLRTVVDELRGTGARGTYGFKSPSDLSRTSYIGHEMQGICGASVNAKLEALKGSLTSAEHRLDQVDATAVRLSDKLSIFQNPFK